MGSVRRVALAGILLPVLGVYGHFYKSERSDKMISNYRQMSRRRRGPARGNRIAGAAACTCESLEPRQFLSVSPAITADQSSSLSVIVGPHQAKFAQFVDAEGNSDIFSLKGPGTATINLVGSDLTTTAKGGGTVLGGSAIGVSSVSVTGTNGHTSVLFSRAKHTAAHAPLPVGSLSTDGAVGTLSGNIDVTGEVTIGGTLGKVSVSGLDGGTTTDPNTGAIVPTSLTASSIGSLTDLGNLGESISVTGAIGKVIVKGSVTGSISGGLITSLTIDGNVTGSAISLGQPLIARRSDLGKLTVAGTVSTSSITAAGNIGPVAARAFSDDTLEAGVTLPTGASGLPAALGDFTSHATISSVKANNTVGTDIAAFTLGKVALGSLQTNNNGVQFGVAGATIAQVTGIASLNGKKFNFRKLNNPATAAADLAKLGITGTDFTIAIV
jgi:hypothetical protein